MPKSDGSLSAVIVSGGKQYRVAPGDQILVDRLAGEPGSSIKLGRVLLLRDGSDIKVGAGPGIEGIDVDAKVLAHRRGPRVESLRYKSKKRVRVHHGGRADLTAIEILAIGGLTHATGTEKAEAKPQAKTTKAKAERKAKPVKASAATETEPLAVAEAKTEAKAPRKAKPATGKTDKKESK